MKRLNDKHRKILEQIKKPEVISEIFSRDKNSSEGQLKNARIYKPSSE